MIRDSKYYSELGKRNKGVKKAWRKNKSWTVQNHTLHNVMRQKNITIQELAIKLNVSDRRVQAWIYEGAMPNKDNKLAAEQILGQSIW